MRPDAHQKAKSFKYQAKHGMLQPKVKPTIQVNEQPEIQDIDSFIDAIELEPKQQTRIETENFEEKGNRFKFKQEIEFEEINLEIDENGIKHALASVPNSVKMSMETDELVDNPLYVNQSF